MRSALVLVFVLSSPALARADAVAPPPDDCPRGAIGETSHSGQWCMPTTCTTSGAECMSSGDQTARMCEPQGLCVETEAYHEGGMRPVGIPSPTLTRDVARSVCASDADCTAPAHCVVAPRCVAVSHPIAGLLGRACGCRVGGRREGAAGALALGAIVIAMLAGRRACR